jgi:YD repeat-containing protein
MSEAKKPILLTFVLALIGLWPCSAYAARYEYDALNRLTRVLYNETTSIEYTYDAVGNRTRRLVIEPPNPDINLSGTVNLVDLAKLANKWLEEGDHQKGDLNRDGSVDINDLKILANYWLQSSEPL